MKKTIIPITAFLLLFSTTFTYAQKSVFVIADINGGNQTPIQAWGIQGNSLFFQAEYFVPDWGAGAVGLALDVDSSFLFVTYENSDVIQLLDATTMTDQGIVTAPGAANLSGIVYDKTNSQLYAIDRMTPVLYSYLWDASDKTLILESIDSLENASGWGLSLDYVDSLLYVANYNFGDSLSSITYYKTSDWSLGGTIDSLVFGKVINVEKDLANNILYYGGIVAENTNLATYDLETGEQNVVPLGNGAGLMGATIDQETGLTYITTGFSGDNIRVFDKNLDMLFETMAIGNPTDIVTGNVGYNPCSFEVITDECAFQGEDHEFSLCYENPYQYPAMGIYIEAEIPEYCTFASSTGGGIYHPDTETVVWDIGTVPPQTPLTCYSLVVAISNDAPFPYTLSLNAVLNGDSIGTVPIGPAYFTSEFYICQIPTCVISGDTTICAGDYALLQLHLTGSPPWEIIYSDGNSQTTVSNIALSPFNLYVSPLLNTVYTVVSVEGAHGLSNTATGSATVNVLSSVIPTISGIEELCLGDPPVNYSTPPELGTTYVWEVTGGEIISGQATNSITVDWPQAIIGIVKVSQTLLSSGCAQSDEKNIFVYDTPVIGFNVGDTTLCPVGDTLMLFPQYNIENANVQWTCGDISNEWHNYTGDTIYVYTTGVGFYSTTFYLNIVTEHGCSDSDSVFVAFNFDVCEESIYENNKNNNVKISPNPIGGKLNVAIAKSLDIPLEITIHDQFGRQVYSGILNSREKQINMASFNDGTYFLRLMNDNTVMTTKFMKISSK